MDQRQSLGGSLFVHGGDRRNGLARVVSLLDGNQGTSVVIGVHISHILCGEHSGNPGKGLSFRGVNIFDSCVGVGATQNLSVEHPWHDDVPNKLSIPSDLIYRIHTGNALSDDVEITFHTATDSVKLRSP